ncbi:hypothetical protein ROHU_002840 [Labeo rohita]|uniref:Stereocilin n=1 Tax=Labeo rohita TaxID=84645 RepID=A0A498NXI4_LABRO|nr:hypothetical protein ROHU_002840 [Labeo rohita]
MLSINGLFNPLETLDNLTPKQVAGLMAENLPGLPEKEVIINRVFDHLLVSPVERGLPDVLQNLLLISQMTIIPCSSYILIFQRLFQALPFLLTEMETVVLHVTEELKQNGARATRVCSGVNSNETLLSAGLVSAPCSVDLQQYACSSLTGFTAENLAGLLKCQLSSSSSYSKEIWKLLFIKANDVLDGALIIFTNSLANMSQPIGGDVVSQVLDVIGELRLERISPDQWSDVTFISMLFTQNLEPFLQFASPSLLQCTSSKNLSCQTYQHILSMVTLFSETQGRNMVDFFILPFLRRNTTDAGCVSTANNSAEWLQKNFGPFSQFVSLTDMLSINGLFNPLETLDNLTPKQVAGLMAENLPGLPEKEVIINRVFDHLLVSPVERGLPDILQNLLLISQMTIIPCSSYILIFQRLFQALPFLSTKMETVVFHVTEELKQNGARVFDHTCECNETLLSAGLVSAPCSVDLQQYACSSLTGFTAENLAGLLKCQLSSSSSYSKEIWKLLFIKANDVLDGALIIFTNSLANMSQPIGGDVVSQVLDVIGELRLERISPDQWSDVTFISMLFTQNLEPFLQFASPSLLQCTSSKNLSCQTYQHIFQRLFQALPFLSTEMETLVLHVTEELKQNGARVFDHTCECNETLLSAGLVSAPCSVDLQQYACSSLTGFTAENLAGLLKCQLSSSSSYSKEIWKLLFIKANDVLDGALIIFTNSLANMSQPIGGDVVSQVLDVIGELRLERISPDQWSDVTFISMLFTQNLEPFLQFASPSLLQCTSSKNLSCQTYQHILSMVTFVSETQGRNMVDFFILPFLRRNTTDAGCVSTANNSTEWLQKNFGPFSQFVSLTDLLSVNGFFNPLETLDNLTPTQVAGLMAENLPGLPEKEVIINRVFDHLLVSPVERGLPDVLQNLLLISQMTIIPCSSYILIFQRLFQALPFLSTKMETVVFHVTEELKQNGARVFDHTCEW